MAGIVEPILLFRELLAAAAGPDDHAHAAQLVLGHALRLEASVDERLLNRSHAQRHRARDGLAVFRVHVPRFVEVHHLAGDLHRIAGRGEARDLADAADATPGGLPERLAPDPVRAYCSN